MKWIEKIKTSIKERWGENLLVKNVPFIVFLTFLLVLSIRSGHSVDEKVHEISKQKKTLKELQAEYIESKSKLMQLGMESHVVEKAEAHGLVESETPPQKIVVDVE